MEDLSRQQVRHIKKEFLESDLSPEIRQAIRSGLASVLLRLDPEAWGIKINLVNDVDHKQILSHFPKELHENIIFDITGRGIIAEQ